MTLYLDDVEALREHTYELQEASRQEGEPIGFLQSSGVSQLSGGHPAKLYPIGATPSPFESSTLVYTHPASADKHAASVPEWIKCSDKMPKINSPVVVARISDNDGKPCLDSGVAALQPNNGWVGLGVFYRPKIDAGTIYQNDLSVMDVTHWMPLPDPPKQEQSHE
jgi:hypothetical protein